VSHRDELWETYFNIPLRFSKKKEDRKYVFNYKILTDGVGVSINLTTRNKLIKKRYIEWEEINS
jgi:hypothetical protein